MNTSKTWQFKTPVYNAKVTIERSVEPTPDDHAGRYLDLDYTVTADTDAGIISWGFVTCLTGDPDSFPEEGVYEDYSQNGPLACTTLSALDDTITITCDHTSYVTRLPAGVVREIVNDLMALAATLDGPESLRPASTPDGPASLRPASTA
jgi:hypothetical protein